LSIDYQFTALLTTGDDNNKKEA